MSFFSLWPLWLLYAIEPFVTWLLYKPLKYRRKIIVGNISRSFPEKSPAEIKQIVKKFYKHLTIITFEAVKSRRIPIDKMCERFQLINGELIEQMSEQYGGAILLTPHFGNWEWGVCIGNQLKTPCISFYKTLHNAKDNAMMLADRNRFKMNLEPVSKAARVMLKNKNSQNSYVLLFDQHPVGTKQTEWITFLNQDTEINTSPAQMAAKFGYPLIYLRGDSIKKGYYTLTASLLEEQPKKEEALQLTKAYMQLLEQQIAENPSEWLWSHRRWKSQKPKDDTSDD
jgi:KDO2-lipid IV(A) lauroyltransferase